MWGNRGGQLCSTPLLHHSPVWRDWCGDAGVVREAPSPGRLQQAASHPPRPLIQRRGAWRPERFPSQELEPGSGALDWRGGGVAGRGSRRRGGARAGAGSRLGPADPGDPAPDRRPPLRGPWTEGGMRNPLDAGSGHRSAWKRLLLTGVWDTMASPTVWGRENDIPGESQRRYHSEHRL